MGKEAGDRSAQRRSAIRVCPRPRFHCCQQTTREAHDWQQCHIFQVEAERLAWSLGLPLALEMPCCSLLPLLVQLVQKVCHKKTYPQFEQSLGSTLPCGPA